MSFSQFQAALENDVARLQHKTLQSLFQDDPNRHSEFSISAAGLMLDYSQQLIDDTLLKHAELFFNTHHFRSKINAQFDGEKVNTTENRAALHTALRHPHPEPDIALQQSKLFALTARFYAGEIKSSTDQSITDVVNIGIGGSDLGPRMVVQALRPYHQHMTKLHFVANVDGSDLFESLSQINPATTLFIISSKSFLTEETLLNAETAKTWLQDKLKTKDVSAHFIAITHAPQKALAWGILQDRILSLGEDIGGRYSLWSSMGLSICLAIGIDNFKDLLAGAHAMDEHFHHAPFTYNLPALLALIAIINQNFLGAKSQAILPYDHTLALFPAYLQQADMESNGKRVTLSGEPISYQTGVVLWGGVGTNGQHAFHQLFHQGTLTIPIDFILPLHPHHPFPEHHLTLMANCYGQIEGLLQGRNGPDVPNHQMIPGNKPCNLITFDQLTPRTLGALIAAYEHKIFMQSLIWNINAFDQWGVELGKILAQPILERLKKIRKK